MRFFCLDLAYQAEGQRGNDKISTPVKAFTENLEYKYKVPLATALKKNNAIRENKNTLEKDPRKRGYYIIF